VKFMVRGALLKDHELGAGDVSAAMSEPCRPSGANVRAEKLRSVECGCSLLRRPAGWSLGVTLHLRPSPPPVVVQADHSLEVGLDVPATVRRQLVGPCRSVRIATWICPRSGLGECGSGWVAIVPPCPS